MLALGAKQPILDVEIYSVGVGWKFQLMADPARDTSGADADFA